MKRLLVDMDDVLADATGQFINFYHREFGVLVDRDQLNHQDEGKGFPGHHDVVREFPFRENFFRTMTPNPNSQEVMEKLNNKYELYIVSAAIEFPKSLPEKLDWLSEHFGFLKWKQIVFCGSKAIVHGDYMIDDLPYNLETFRGQPYLFTAPHNLHFNSFDRLNNWKEIESKFL